MIRISPVTDARGALLSDDNDDFDINRRTEGQEDHTGLKY